MGVWRPVFKCYLKWKCKKKPNEVCNIISYHTYIASDFNLWVLCSKFKHKHNLYLLYRILYFSWFFPRLYLLKNWKVKNSNTLQVFKNWTFALETSSAVRILMMRSALYIYIYRHIVANPPPPILWGLARARINVKV